MEAWRFGFQGGALPHAPCLSVDGCGAGIEGGAGGDVLGGGGSEGLEDLLEDVELASVDVGDVDGGADGPADGAEGVGDAAGVGEARGGSEGEFLAGTHEGGEAAHLDAHAFADDTVFLSVGLLAVLEFGAAFAEVRETHLAGAVPDLVDAPADHGQLLVAPLGGEDAGEGAVLLGRSEREVYPTLPGLIGDINLGTWQGEEVTCFASLLTAYDCKNITITGGGLADGNAPSGDWYVNHRVMRVAWRPRGAFFNRCSGVTMFGLTVRNTPSWNIHPYFCKDVGLYDLCLYNPSGMPTTDGIDPDTCDGVEIAGVKISVGDDCIAIKSGTIEQAKKYRLPCRNVVIRNCLMRDGHGGVVLGSELSGGIENVSVTQCIFDGTDRGLRIKNRRGRGRIGVTDNIVFEDIKMTGVKVPFVVNMYYNMGDNTGHTEYVYTTEKLPVDERTPCIGSFKFKNISCTDVAFCAGAFYGLPEAPIAGIAFENVSFSYDNSAEAGYPDMKEINKKVKNEGLYFQFVEKVSLKNVTVDGQCGDAVVLDGVGEFVEEK